MKRDLGVSSSPPKTEAPIHDTALKSPGALAKMAFLYSTPEPSKQNWGPKFTEKASSLRASHSAPVVTAFDPTPTEQTPRESSTPVELSTGAKPSGPRLSLPVPKPYVSSSTTTTVVRPVEVRGLDQTSTVQGSLQSSGTGPISGTKSPVTSVAKINVLEPMSESSKVSVASSCTEEGAGVSVSTYPVKTSSGKPVAYRIPVKYMVTNPPGNTETVSKVPAPEAKTVVIKPVKLTAQELETKFV